MKDIATTLQPAGRRPHHRRGAASFTTFATLPAWPIARQALINSLVWTAPRIECHGNLTPNSPQGDSYPFRGSLGN